MTQLQYRHSLTLFNMALPTQLMQIGFVGHNHFPCHGLVRELAGCVLVSHRQQAHLAELGVSHDGLNEVCWANANFLC